MSTPSHPEPTTAPASLRPVVGLVGNPAPGSRTAAVTELVLSALRYDDAGARPDPEAIVELADQRRDVFGEDAGLASTRQRVADAGVLVVATPSYKGSFTGLLKLFLDGLPAGALAGTVVVPVVVAGSPVHATTTDAHLRWVLGELGASLPVPSVVLTERQLDGTREVVDMWRAAHRPSVLAVVEALGASREPAGAGVSP
ncbi:MAG TPA: NAD(P)H-dependent oxidoreductase [Nocardioides sp.]|uniref:NADPH-dependent FMN reductase n=1 Tax=Nocardioides sp. TaxID=35761 RepID=UPI002D7FC0DC|nr:NAD(P)H-dependent oxidoreductase [Nocardioides sp.]HET6652476.1 NAD(P)H-dependent oxidoreductase [Nocardioides sp.]